MKVKVFYYRKEIIELNLYNLLQKPNNLNKLSVRILA